MMSRAKSPIYKVLKRRRREGRTNYQKRLGMVKSGLPRMVVRRSNRYVTVQFINFDPLGDRTLLNVTGPTLAKKFNWQAKRNVWSAYLTGLYAGTLAKKAGVSDFILDSGMYTASAGNIVFAALKGALDSGLKTNFEEDKIPLKKLSTPPDQAAFEDVKKKIIG